MPEPDADALKAGNDNRSQAWRDALFPIPQIFSWYKDNVAAGTLLVAAFLIFKGYVLAKGDLSTALGILQYAGLTNVLIAGLLSSLPILAAAMLAVTVYRETRAFRSWVWRMVAPWFRPKIGAHGALPANDKWGLALTVTGLGAFVLAAAFTPWPYMAAAIGIGLVTGMWPGLDQRRDRSKIVRGLIVVAVWGFWVVITLTAVYGVTEMLATVWVPHETVTFARRPVQGQPTRPEVGYVLADDPGGWITILISGEHGIVRYRDSLVESITVCEKLPYGGWSDIIYARTPWQVVTKPSSRLRPAFLGTFVQNLHPSANKTCPRGPSRP